jgi:hypothetical protein
MKTLKRISLLLALGAALALAGCGGDDDEGAPIPSAQVQLLEGRLTETENRLGDGSLGACEDILNDTMPEVTRVLDSLPNDVDPDVRTALEDSFNRLWQFVEDECRDRQPEESAEPEPDPEPTTPETETETETVPPDTETAPTEPDEETLPPEGDGDNEGVIPEGQDGGGGGFGPGNAEGQE